MPTAYRAPAWLRGPHLQTVWPVYSKPALPPYRRERWNTPDTPEPDFLHVDRVDGRPGAPTLVLFHGLEGSSDSSYARLLMQAIGPLGWHGLVPHFRGCGGPPDEINLLPRAYHSGDSDEIDWILRRVKAEAGDAPVFALGVSLGGNALAKWLGLQGAAAEAVLRAACVVSAPQDLAASAAALSAGLNRAYTRHFLQTMIPKSLARLERWPGLYDRERVQAARTFFDFDELVTGPLHGFAGAIDYWTRSSCRQFLGGIRVPTLMINALNDPFLPPSNLATPREVSSNVELLYPDEGGHVGFPPIGDPASAWLARRALDFLQRHL